MNGNQQMDEVNRQMRALDYIFKKRGMLHDNKRHISFTRYNNRITGLKVSRLGLCVLLASVSICSYALATLLNVLIRGAL